jgi:hypothetical protein
MGLLDQQYWQGKTVSTHVRTKRKQQFTVQPTSTSVMVAFLTDELRFFTFALDKVCTVRTGWLVGVFLLE